MFIGLTIALSPVIELAWRDSEPTYKTVSRQLGTLGPVIDVIDDGITCVVRDPGATQSPPSSFFS